MRPDLAAPYHTPPSPQGVSTAPPGAVGEDRGVFATGDEVLGGDGEQMGSTRGKD